MVHKYMCMHTPVDYYQQSVERANANIWKKNAKSENERLLHDIRVMMREKGTGDQYLKWVWSDVANWFWFASNRIMAAASLWLKWTENHHWQRFFRDAEEKKRFLGHRRCLKKNKKVFSSVFSLSRQDAHTLIKHSDRWHVFIIDHDHVDGGMWTDSRDLSSNKTPSTRNDVRGWTLNSNGRCRGCIKYRRNSTENFLGVTNETDLFTEAERLSTLLVDLIGRQLDQKDQSSFFTQLTNRLVKEKRSGKWSSGLDLDR